MADAAAPPANESVPSKLGRFAGETIDKAEVAVSTATGKVREATGKIIGVAEDTLGTLNTTVLKTKDTVSNGINTAINEAETKLKGITPPLKKMGEDAIEKVRGQLDGLAGEFESKLVS